MIIHCFYCKTDRERGIVDYPCKCKGTGKLEAFTVDEINSALISLYEYAVTGSGESQAVKDMSKDLITQLREGKSE